MTPTARAAAEALAATPATVSAVELPFAAGAPAVEAWRRAFPDSEQFLESADLAGARRLFTAFGTCSISEPIDGPQTLGLLHA
jgi:hypothetical protein